MKHLTIIVAHPDDEVIFGAAILKEAKKIVCVASDENNPARAWCKDRKKALTKIGELLGIETACLGYNSEFYRQADPRTGGLIAIEKDLLPYIFGNIFTHNAWGEYGHMDHILVNQIVRAHSDHILTTDICLQAGWFNVRKLPQGSLFKRVTIDPDLYVRCKAIYDKYGCWTWSKSPIVDVGVCEA